MLRSQFVPLDASASKERFPASGNDLHILNREFLVRRHLHVDDFASEFVVRVVARTQVGSLSHNAQPDHQRHRQEQLLLHNKLLFGCKGKTLP
jgi:hypothetical protein